MTNEFLNLPQDSQASLISSAVSSIGMLDAVIEKDIWVCTLLDIIFSMPYDMVFKGGTSLSKAYGLIKRFSEDIDITIDYKHFRDPINIKTISKSQLKKISAELKSALQDFTKTKIAPYLKEKLLSQFPKMPISIEISEDGEQVRVYYPTVLSKSLGYLRDHVLLEFGIRSEIEPSEQRIIRPYILDVAGSDIALPQANIATLSPVRTFWEKSTLIHVEQLF